MYEKVGLSGCSLSKVNSFGKRVAADCAALPTANADQYATLHCKPLLYGFPVSGGIYTVSQKTRQL